MQVGKEMLLAIPLTDRLFKHRGFSKVLRYIVSTGSCKRSSVVKAASISPKTAWLILKRLKEMGHIGGEGCKWMDEDFITVNLRDVLVDDLFRFSGTRQFLYLLGKEEISLSEAAYRLAMSYPAVKKLAAELRRAGVLSDENKVRSELLRQPEDPLDLIPRKEHRRAVRFFLGESKFNGPLLIHGDASWGLKVLEIDLLALVKKADGDTLALVRDLASAASATTMGHGFSFGLTVATFSAWFENRLVQTPNQTLLDAADGICVRGTLPRDEDYFEFIEGAADEERINELLNKGYIRRTEKGFAYTDRALNEFQKFPAVIKETHTSVNEKTIKIISASMRVSSLP